VPPSRRQSRTPTPPVRRPRVAGLRRPGAGRPVEPADPEQLRAEPEPVAPEEKPEVLDEEPPRWSEPDDLGGTVALAPVIGEPDTKETDSADSALEEPAEAGEEPAEPAPSPVARPSGKHRAQGLRRPESLAEAEAELTAVRTERPRRDNTLTWAIVLAVVALILAGLAVWFRGEVNSRTEGADSNNHALTDPATQSEVVRQLRTAIEKTLTYNYTDLDSTAKAVQDNLSGKALCEYDQLFGEVKKLAPQQKIVLTTQVREIGVTRLEGNQALLLVFVDQSTTRADQNQTTASGAQFNIKAERQGDRWKITEFDMLGQPLPNGKPAPQC
jgi:Mce-associated membrane protein